MEVREGSTLTFDIPAIFRDMEYDLVVRHEHKPEYPNEWNDANVELIRVDGPVNPAGTCNHTQDGKIPFSMNPDSTYTEIVDPPLCLEEGQRYKIQLTFDQYDAGAPNPGANILIDSVIIRLIFLTILYFTKFFPKNLIENEFNKSFQSCLLLQVKFLVKQ